MGGNSLWLVNRPLRIRTMGGVGAVGEKPTATRLDHFLINYEVIFYFTLTPIIYPNYFFIRIVKRKNTRPEHSLPLNFYGWSFSIFCPEDFAVQETMAFYITIVRS